MLNELLIELNTMFSQCTSLLDGVTKKKMGFFKNKTIDAKKLSEDELKLIAATRSLAGAVKSVIDMPILTPEGVIFEETDIVYKDVKERLSAIVGYFKYVQNINYHVKPIVPKKIYKKINQKLILILCLVE